MILAILLSLAFPLGAPNPPPVFSQPPTIRAEPWPEADLLFKRDRHWRGGDDAYSLDLGGGRVVWLFADSFIALTPGGSRRESTMVRNTVAVQDGYDPASASIRFYWRNKNGKPSSFFPESRTEWYWPGDGVLVGGRLLIFLMKVHEIKSGLGFEAFGWTVVSIDNPQQEPSKWNVRWLNVPNNHYQVIVGSASVFTAGDYVYAFSAQEPHAKHDVYLVRWPISRVAAGDLRDPFWWCGPENQWISQRFLRTQPSVVFSGAQTEFTVHWDATLRRYLQIQTAGFGKATLAARWSEEPTGAWSGLQSFYEPAESNRVGAFVYAGKAHPELKGSDLVLTYVANHSDFGQLVSDSTLYYPRFLKAWITR